MDALLEELVQRELDGGLTPSELEKLHARLQRDPQLRQYRVRLQSIDAELRSIGIEEAPAGLEIAVLGTICRTELPTRQRVSPSPRRLRVPWREALAFAAGLTLMAGLLSRDLLPGEAGPSGERARGTLLPSPTGTVAPVPSSLHEGTVPVGIRGLRYRVFALDDGETAVELEAPSASPESSPEGIALTWLASDWSWSGIETTGRGAGAITVLDSALQWQPREGSVLRLRFQSSGTGNSPLRLRLTTTGTTGEIPLRLPPQR